MKAAVVQGPGQLEVQDIPIPDLGPTDVLVEVDRCGVCGTDLHLVLEGWGAPGTVPGHEWTGVVSEVGSEVTAWRTGDAVVGGPLPRCGTCRHCAAGRPSLCDARATPGIGEHLGALAQFTVVDQRSLVALPEGLAPRVAALAEPVAVALHGIELARVRPGQRVLVFGAGPIGALTIAALRAMGIDDVGCVEPGERRRQLAVDVGATYVKVPGDLYLPTIVEPGLVVDGAVDVVFECSGKARAMEAGLGQLERGGTLVLVGAGIDPPRFDSNRILLNELVITGSYEYGVDGFAQALALLASGRLPVDRLLEPEDVPLTGALDAMRKLADGTLAGKVLIKP
jgi:(R,R)-butanediol dehydrogenase / meso-butanediol dehydrogenase / diacetyl reductase